MNLYEFLNSKLFIVHTTFVPLFTLNWYNNDNNKKLLSLLLLATYNLFVNTALIHYSSHSTIRYYSAHNLFVSSNLYSLDLLQHATETQDWLITTHSSIALSCIFIVQNISSNERSWNGRFLFSPSRQVYCDRLYTCILIHVIPSCLVIGVY